MVAVKPEPSRWYSTLIVAKGMGECGCEVVERAEMRCYADCGEARAGGLNAGNEGEHVVDGVCGPGVGVRAGVSRDFGPGAEVHGQKFAPGVERLEVVSAMPAWSSARAR